MIEKYLCANWDEPPEEMGFVLKFSDLVIQLRHSLEEIITCVHDSKMEKSLYLCELAKKIYLLAPALPRVALNYKICMDFGLPFDLTQSVDFDTVIKDSERYNPREKEQASLLFREAISTARLAYMLSPDSLLALSMFSSHLPKTLREAEFANRKDASTWMASNPEHIKSLAEEMDQKINRPDLIVGVANGSICPGLLLSNLLGCDLYFVRFSFFKKENIQPIISDQDKRFFSQYYGKVVLFDEDVATGQTLRKFTSALSPLFQQSSSAAVLRFYLASFQPDFVGKTLYDQRYYDKLNA